MTLGRVCRSQKMINSRVTSEGRKHMRKDIIWLWTMGSFGLLAAANAQPASPPANTQFDGVYAFVSATKVVFPDLNFWGAADLIACRSW
jgi:hypothetical protein